MKGNHSHASLRVAQVGDLVCVRIAGRATVHASVSFKRFMRDQIDRGRYHFVLELSQCQIMDSTFLGVMASLASQLQATTQPNACMELVNGNERVLGLIDNLGVLGWFRVTENASDSGQPVDASSVEMAQSLALEPGSREEMARTSLAAHQVLMALHPDNEQKFKEVTTFLEEQLGEDATRS